MAYPAAIESLLRSLERGLDTLQSPLALVVRLWVGWQFFKSGWIKLQDWEGTVFLFTEEYHVPLLPPEAAAVAGTAGELLFPVLLALGIFGRVGAVGLFAVNALAVYSYRHVLLSPGFEAAAGQHYLWGFMLLVLAVFGLGRFTLDDWLLRRAPRRT